jgi:hypothetical protein
MNTMDAEGNRGVTTGNTPAAGMAAVAEAASAKPMRDVPKLALVTDDYAPYEVPPPKKGSKTTKQIEQIEGPDAEGQPTTTRERIKQARRQSSFIHSRNGRIVIVAGALLLLALLAFGVFTYMRDQQKKEAAAFVPPATATRPAPTPTGLGDATPTPLVTPTPVPPAVGVIGTNGWVAVTVSGNLSLREAPSRTAKRLAILPNGTKGRVVDGPQDADGITWWKIDVPDKGIGWSSGQYLEATTPP